MQVNIPNNGKDFFDENKALLLVNEFKPFIVDSYLMIFISLVADYQSPFFKQDNDRKRELACLCTPKLHRGDNVSEEGKKLIKGTNKKVEEAIAYYSRNINPQKEQMAVKIIESLQLQWESICNVLKFGASSYEKDENGNDKKDKKGNKIPMNPEELLKIQEQCNRITKDGLDKKIWASIEFYEEKLNYIYKPKEVIAKKIDTTETQEEGIAGLSDKIDNL